MEEGVKWLVVYMQAAPTPGPCPLLPPNTQTSTRALLEGGGGAAEEEVMVQEREHGDWVPSQMEGFAMKHVSGTNHSVC